MLTDSEKAVQGAIRELYVGQVVSEELRDEAAQRTLALTLKPGNSPQAVVVVNLSKLAALYENGTSLAAIKTVSRFSL